MILNFLCKLTGVSLLTIAPILGVDLSNPLTLLLLFILFHLLPSSITGILLAYLGLVPDQELGHPPERRFVFYLYPLYPIFIPPRNYGIGEYITWTVFFFPVFEEVLFFATPALYGFATGDYHTALMMSLICGAFWIAIHVVRSFTAWVSAGYSVKQSVLGVLAMLISFIPACVLSAILWVSGLGVVSILFHSIYNGLASLSYVLPKPSRPKEPRKYYRLLRRKYYIIREFEE